MNALFFTLITLGTFLFMEGVSWFTHKYIMHGLLWSWHRDHHQPHPGMFERNDRFFLLFSVPSTILMILGSFETLDYRFFIGLGILFYGMAYFFVHDLFIHQRIRVLTRSKNPYLRAIRKAHKVHHKHLGKEEGECFGMLLVPWRYFRESFRTSG